MARADDDLRVRVRGDHDYPPYEYLEKGRPTGFNVDVMRAVAETMGLDAVIDLGPWDEVRAQLEAGEIDVLTGMYQSSQRDLLVDFTSPHSVVFHSLFVRRGADIRSPRDLAGRTLVVQRGDIMHDYAVKHMRGATILPVSTQAEALRTVASGVGDAALVASLQGHYNVERFGLENIVEVDHPMEPRRYCFAVTEGRDDLRVRLDEGLAILRQSGRFDRIYDKWFGRFEERSVLRKALWYAGLALVPLLVVLAVTLAWTWSLRRTVASRTAELATSEERYRSIFENIMDGYYHADMDGNLILVNPSALRMLGYESLDDLPTGNIGRDLYVNPGLRDRFLQRLQKEGRINGYVIDVKRKDGEHIFLEVNSRLLTGPDGTPVGLEGVLREVTGRVRSQEALRRAKEEAEAASRAKSEFLSNMSHELRTPLNGVMGMLQILSVSDGLSDEELGYVNTALRSGRSLTMLLGDILDLSRVEAGRLRLSREEFVLVEVLEEIADTFVDTSSSRGVSLELDAGPGLPRRLVGDPVRLRQVLFNLVGNAVKFTSHGRVTLGAYVLAASGPGRCRLLFMVSDTGIGIPEEAMDIIFDPFTQVDASHTRSYQGAGLGLQIVKRLVELMDGGLGVESEVGAGTTVYCSLPFDLPSNHVGDEPGEPVRTYVSLAGVLVLLVEDDPGSSLAVRLMLERQGMTVHVVSDGREALAMLADREYDGVFMDVQMPGMDGVETVRLLRSDPAYRSRSAVPVVALTAHAMEGDRERFLEAGMNAYLSKPVDAAELLAVLRRVIRPG